MVKALAGMAERHAKIKALEMANTPDFKNLEFINLLPVLMRSFPGS